jgi:hypothetical protein
VKKQWDIHILGLAEKPRDDRNRLRLPSRPAAIRAGLWRFNRGILPSWLPHYYVLAGSLAAGTDILVGGVHLRAPNRRPLLGRADRIEHEMNFGRNAP